MATASSLVKTDISEGRDTTTQCLYNIAYSHSKKLMWGGFPIGGGKENVFLGSLMETFLIRVNGYPQCLASLSFFFLIIHCCNNILAMKYLLFAFHCLCNFILQSLTIQQDTILFLMLEYA